MPQDARILDFTAFADDNANQPTGKKGRKQAAKHKSGLFRLHFRYKDPITGTACQKDVYGATKAEAERKKKAFLKQVEQGLRVAENGRTLSQWADEWLSLYKRGKVRANTYRLYSSEVERIKKYFGSRPLNAVLQSDIISFLSTRKGLSGSTVRMSEIVINAVMEAAVNNRLIPFNPCRGVESLKGPNGTHRALTREEIDVINKVAASGHYFARPIMIMLYAGLRRGEVSALTAEDINDERIDVSKAIEFSCNEGKISTTKTDAGIRTVPIFSPLRPYLLNLPSGYIVTGAGGNREENITEGAFRCGMKSFISECRRIMPDITFQAHDLRHTFATMLYDAGVDIKTAQLWLGHSNPAITMQVYTHLSAQRKNVSKDSVERYFSGGGINGGTK